MNFVYFFTDMAYVPGNFFPCTVDLVICACLNFCEFLILGLLTKFRIREFSFFISTVVIRYNTIGGVHKYESCYKPIVLYEMARFYLILLDTI